MTAVYFDLDQFGYRDVHRILEREFSGMGYVLKKFFGDKERLANLPEDITAPYECIQYEKKKREEANVADFMITIEISKDLQNPKINQFIVASRDTDYRFIGEAIQKAGRHFGILVIENKDKKKHEEVSPLLQSMCDILYIIRCGNISKKCSKSMKKLLVAPAVEEVPVQTVAPIQREDVVIQSEPIKEVSYTHLQLTHANYILAWIDFNCKSYKKIALDIDQLIHIAKQKADWPYLHYIPIQRTAENYIFSPIHFACTCAKFTDPFLSRLREGEHCPVFHLYKEGKIQCEVLGPDLQKLQEAIWNVYKIDLMNEKSA
jgi:hypothetical protein